MPFDGEKFDELLSGYLDDQLSDEERRQVEAELADSLTARSRLEELRETSQLLKQHFQHVSTRDKLGSEFAARVIAAAHHEVHRSGSAADHYVTRSRPLDPTAGDREHVSQLNSPTWTWKHVAAVAGVLAAALLLAIALPRFFEKDAGSEFNNSNLAAGPGNAVPPEDSTNDPNGEDEDQNSSPTLAQESSSNPLDSDPSDASNAEPESANGNGPQYVSQMDFGSFFYLLVVDVEITSEAFQQGVLPDILQQSGIEPFDPIVASPEVQEALSQARVTVRPDDGSVESSAIVYFMRASVIELGKALDEVYADQNSFPRVALDLGFDSPNSRLMKMIAKGTGTRFTVNQRFAAPVAVQPEHQQGSPLSGLDAPARYVSSSQRESGFGQLPSGNANSDAEDLTTMLLFVRVVE